MTLKALRGEETYNEWKMMRVTMMPCGWRPCAEPSTKDLGEISFNSQ
jgi:hypothetical protein